MHTTLSSSKASLTLAGNASYHPLGEASFLSSQFADGEADVEKGTFARKSGPGSHRGDSWLPASNFSWGDDGKTQWD